MALFPCSLKPLAGPHIFKRIQNFTFQLENDRRTVQTSLFFNVNFYSEISFKKFVDSDICQVSKYNYHRRFS